MDIKINQFEGNLIYNILDLIIEYFHSNERLTGLYNMISTPAISYSRQEIGFVRSLK